MLRCRVVNLSGTRIFSDWQLIKRRSVLILLQYYNWGYYFLESVMLAVE